MRSRPRPGWRSRVAAHPVAAPVGGRIVETRLAVGRDVRSGEVLVALDGAAEQFAIREKRVYRDALVGRLAALQEEIRAEQEATAAKHGARSAASAESVRPARRGRGPSPAGPSSGLRGSRPSSGGPPPAMRSTSGTQAEAEATGAAARCWPWRPLAESGTAPSMRSTARCGWRSWDARPLRSRGT